MVSRVAASAGHSVVRDGSAVSRLSEISASRTACTNVRPSGLLCTSWPAAAGRQGAARSQPVRVGADPLRAVQLEAAAEWEADLEGVLQQFEAETGRRPIYDVEYF